MTTGRDSRGIPRDGTGRDENPIPRDGTGRDEFFRPAGQIKFYQKYVFNFKFEHKLLINFARRSKLTQVSRKLHAKAELTSN